MSSKRRKLDSPIKPRKFVLLHRRIQSHQIQYRAQCCECFRSQKGTRCCPEQWQFTKGDLIFSK